MSGPTSPRWDETELQLALPRYLPLHLWSWVCDVQRAAGSHWVSTIAGGPGTARESALLCLLLGEGLAFICTFQDIGREPLGPQHYVFRRKLWPLL